MRADPKEIAAMSDDEIEYSLDVIREAMARAFNAGNRRDAKRFGFVFHALLRERAERTSKIPATS